MKSATKSVKSAPEFKVGDHVVATTGATDNCPATGVVCNIGKGWFVITLDQPEAFPSVKSGKVSARAGSMALYVPKVVEEPVPAISDDVDAEPSAGVIEPSEKLSAASMAEQLRAARVHYAKTKRPDGASSADCADAIAKALRDYEPVEVCEVCDRVFGLEIGTTAHKYFGLNPGQKRMNAGNRIRASWKKAWAAGDRREIARIADLVGVALPDDFLDEVMVQEMEEQCKLVDPQESAIPLECIGGAM